MAKKIVLYIVKNLFVFAALCVLWLSDIGGVSAFAPGLYFALIFLTGTPIALSVVYIGSAVTVSADAQTLISALICVFIGCLTVLIYKKVNRQIPFTVMAAAAAIGESGLIWFSYASGQQLIMLVVNFCFSIIFMYICVCALKPLLKYKMKYKLLETELACLGIMLMVFASGLASVNIGKFRLIYAVSVFILLAIAYTAGKGASLAASLCLGIGYSLRVYDVSFAALLPFIAVVVSVFVSAPRIIPSAAACLAAVIFKLYFSADYSFVLYDLASAAAGGILFSVIPYGWIEYIKNYYFASHSKLAVRHLINRSREETASSVKGVSDIFSEMSAALNADGGQSINAEAISAEIKCSVCAECKNFEKCKREGLEAALYELIEATLKKGRASVTDLPSLVGGNCGKIAHLISAAYDGCRNEIARLEKKKRDNAVKNDLAQQLDGISGILDGVSARMCAPMAFDFKLEKMLIEELCYHGIICSEALISKDGLKNVTLIVRSECADSKKASFVAGKVLGGIFEAESEEKSLVAGYSVIVLKEKTKYDVVFGVGNVSKSREATGDTHSFTKIGDSKFMMALCDGMGSGKTAGKVSETAIGLVENFYRAGFDSRLILKSVNRFLSYDSDESFSALDILVCDLNDKSCDIIKIGSPPSYIKRPESVLRIDGNSLPLGLIGEITPHITSGEFSDGEFIVFVSDGVADCFEGDSLAECINSSETLNPKMLASEVLKAAAEKSGGAVKDDMTVIAARLFLRV